MTNIRYELVFRDSVNNNLRFYFDQKHEMMRYFKKWKNNFFGYALNKLDGKLILCGYNSSGRIFPA